MSVLLIATLGSGCAFSRTRVRYYEPPAVSAFTPVAHRWEALEEMVHEQGWSIETVDQARGRLVVVTAPTDGLRERIAITLHPRNSTISITSEHLTDGRWSPFVPYVCATYGYFREKAIAQTIDNRSADGQPGLPARSVAVNVPRSGGLK